MKRKILFLLVTIIGITLYSCNSDDDDVVSGVTTDAVKSAFTSKYPSAQNVNWENKVGYQVADFINNSVISSAWYDSKGTWYMTESDIPYTALPTGVKSTFEASEYATWRIDDIDMLERTGYETIYVIEVELQDTEVDLYYSTEGILIKSIVDSDNKDSQNYIPTPTPTDIESFIKTKYANARIMEIDEEDGMIEIEIIHDNMAKEVYFNQQKEWLYTSWDIKKHSVPTTVTNAISNSAYANYEIDDINYIETSTSTYYLVELERGDSEIKIKIDANGNIIEGNNTNTSNNDTTGPSTTPSDIETFIKNKYTNANIIEIDTDNGMIEVDIIHENTEKNVYFNLQKQWLYTSWDVHTASLPTAVTSAINSSAYAGYRIDDADYIETNTGSYYLIELEKGNIETKIKIDLAGNILP